LSDWSSAIGADQLELVIWCWPVGAEQLERDSWKGERVAMSRPSGRITSLFLLALMLIIVLIIVAGCQTNNTGELRDGDLIFQRSLSAQSDALERALNSPYTHMGIIFFEDEQPQVYEAAGPVQITPLAEWVARGQGGKHIVKRLRKADTILTPAAISNLKREVQRHLGVAYDPLFLWSDDQLYCSELVWKAYQRALDLEIGTTTLFGDHDFSDPLVQALLKKRFGDNIPRDETVISPADMFASEKLVTVREHWIED
jgi:hypothetical protein